MGSYLQIMKHLNPSDESRGHPFNEFVNDEYFEEGKKVPDVVGFVLGTTVALMINTPEIVADLFVAKNKYFDKHPYSAKLFSRMFGDSILFAKSDLKW